jgi:Mlc titration factor MtfA (ptsG expression regulator)
MEAGPVTLAWAEVSMPRGLRAVANLVIHEFALQPARRRQ